MSISKILSVTALTLTLAACGPSGPPEFSLITNAKNKKIGRNDTLKLSVHNPKNVEIEAIEYLIDGQPATSSIHLDAQTLGKHEVAAKITYDGGEEIVNVQVQILNNTAPKIYGFEIVNEYPHDINSYTQGLEFKDSLLFESTGQRGKSKLRKLNYKTGEVLQDVDLNKQYFGEGLTILNDKIYQLTWQSGTGFVYDLETLERQGSFKYNESKEGWGLCNDGKVLYKTDGSERIWILNPETLTEERYIQAYTHKGQMSNINELEWVNGKIYANRYQKDGVAIINPTSGAIEGVIDFTPLKKLVTQHPELDVLNGLAWNPNTQTLFVTGKHWDKLFEVRITEK